VLYDASTSYYEGRTCPLARFGHDRDGKNLAVILYGLLTDQAGRPVAVEVYPGNTGGPGHGRRPGREATRALFSEPDGHRRRSWDADPDSDREAQTAPRPGLDLLIAPAPRFVRWSRAGICSALCSTRRTSRRFARRSSRGTADRVLQPVPRRRAAEKARGSAPGDGEGTRAARGRGQAANQDAPRQGRDRGGKPAVSSAASRWASTSHSPSPMASSRGPGEESRFAVKRIWTASTSSAPASRPSGFVRQTQCEPTRAWLW